MNQIYKRNIFHRDLNVNNVMLHFPDCEPTPEELQDPNLLINLEARVKRRVVDLTEGNFTVKVIDFGLAC